MEAQLQVEEGASQGAVLVLNVGETKTVGQGPGADLQLRDAALAPRHLALRLVEEGLEVIDLAGGTRLNDTPLPSRTPTRADSGDLIRLGQHALRALVLGGRAGRRRREAELPFPPAEFTSVQRVGSGATGVVYRATWLPHQRPVALKLLREEYGLGTLVHSRFLRECQTVSRVRCPYVVEVFDVRASERAVYMIMALVEGPALEAALAKAPLAVPAALRVAEDVARALTAAASARVVHRDVKPANVLLDRRAGLARLCDFGLAKDLQATLATLTRQGIGLGTLAYLPPEQVSAARDAGPAADVYSLGATLFHALSGAPPFRVDTEAQLRAVLAAEPPRLDAHRSDLPPGLSDLVSATLHKDPGQRPAAEALAEALAEMRAARYPGWDPRSLFAR